ncbi:MAG: GNAT family N-acetyltransferase [Ruminococcaceae bacterium]|nr:GNAT family N-acetyltransferase [Oscillospiraceae bacterium]
MTNRIVQFSAELQQQADAFFQECFSAVGIPYSPADRHADVADIEGHYMQNGCFWCMVDGEGGIVGTVALRVIDAENRVVELKRMFVLPKQQGKGYGRRLLDTAIAYAREQGYSRICLDTRRQFAAAQHLYKSSGFVLMDRYNDNEFADFFFELEL